MVVIDAQALAKRFGELDAVQSITFAGEAGERLAYIGPNGAGTSTSIKTLTGILYPTGGTATVLGLVPWCQRRQLALLGVALFRLGLRRYASGAVWTKA